MSDMSLGTDADLLVVPRQRPRVAAAVAVIGVLSLLIVTLLMLLDRVEVQTHQELAQVAFGMPLDWVKQDQAFLDPPVPYRAGFYWPWESPATIDFLPLVVNAALVGLVLLGVWRVVRVLRDHRSTD